MDSLTQKAAIQSQRFPHGLTPSYSHPEMLRAQPQSFVTRVDNKTLAQLICGEILV